VVTPEQKDGWVGWLAARMSERRFIVVGHPPVDVGTVAALRASLPAGTELRVVKGTLARLAAERAGVPEALPLIAGPTAVVFTDADLACAAALVDRSAAVEVRGAVEGDRLLPPSQVSAIAAIGSRERALAMVLSALRSPALRTATALRARESEIR
jgi:large subunit ribosomal protein L10